MNDSREIKRGKLRIIMIVASLVGLTLLTTAGILKPSKHGSGTHRQLGLPPCGVLLYYGRPCPSCGMTTAWSNLMRGRLAASIQANPAGTWLGSWVLVISLWAVASSIRGRWLLLGPNEWFFLALAVSSLLFVLSVWVIRFFF